MFTFLMGIGLGHLLLGGGALAAAGIVSGSIANNKRETEAAVKRLAAEKAQLETDKAAAARL
jgi:outer membrane murein-binding lipoprotein Lpp